MTIGYEATANESVAIGVGAVCTSNNSIAIGCNATANGFRTPIQHLYIDILKYKYKVVKCRRKKNVIDIATEVPINSKLNYERSYKLEPKDDVE